MKTLILLSTLMLTAAAPAMAFDPQPDPPKSQTVAGDGSVRTSSIRAGDGSVRTSIGSISAGSISR